MQCAQGADRLETLYFSAQNFLDGLNKGDFPLS